MIRIKIAAYALNDFLWYCHCSGIKDINITKEDGELIIYIKPQVQPQVQIEVENG